MDGEPCPIHGVPVWLLSTDNPFHWYCKLCDKRYNDRWEAMGEYPDDPPVPMEVCMEPILRLQCFASVESAAHCIPSADFRVSAEQLKTTSLTQYAVIKAYGLLPRKLQPFGPEPNAA